MKKLKWYTDPSKDSISENHWTDKNFGYKIEVRQVVHFKRHMFVLLSINGFVGYFKKLSSAKKVAQLIYNG